jgi:hypothetical protein
MKKKYRNITVTGVKYGWMATSDGKEKNLTVWLNKKVLFYKRYRQQSVTPKDVSDAINHYLGQSLDSTVFLKDPKGLDIFKKTYTLQGFVYLDDDDKPTDCSSMVKWLNKLEIKARTEKQADELAFEFLNKNYPEYNGFMKLF